MLLNLRLKYLKNSYKGAAVLKDLQPATLLKINLFKSIFQVFDPQIYLLLGKLIFTETFAVYGYLPGNVKIFYKKA